MIKIIINFIDNKGGSLTVKREVFISLALIIPSLVFASNFSITWSMLADSSLEIICTSLSGGLDFVFVLDTTGSMYGDIDSALAYLDDFADSMDALGIDYAFGLVTYGDGWNFPHGYNLTESADTFSMWLLPIGSAGGADAPEEALDAIMAAVDSINWRTGTIRIIILITDACFCQRTSTCTRYCHSSWMPAEVRDTLLAENIILFVATPSHISCSSCAGTGTWALNWYRNMAETTGGAWFNLYSNFGAIYDSILEMIDTTENIILQFVNTETDTIETLYATINVGSCITIDSGTTIETTLTVEPGETVTFEWVVEFSSGCSGRNACFGVVIWSGSDTLRRFGCLTRADCECPLIPVWIACPESCPQLTSCADQIMIFGVYDSTGAGIDTANVYIRRVTTSGMSYVPLSQLDFYTFGDTTFITVHGSFGDGDTITLHFDSLFTTQGCKMPPW